MNLRLYIPVTPRTKKTSNRVMRFGKFNKVMPSEAFIDFQNAALPHLVEQFRPRESIATPVNVRATFYRDANRGDLVGYMTALADVLERAGVVANDKWIMGWDGTRLDKDAARPRVELVIEGLGGYCEDKAMETER